MIVGLSAVLVLVLSLNAPLNAQQPDSGTVNVTVREAMGMVEGFLVRSENRSATTDASGRARLVLPAGQRTLVVTRIGFVPKRVTVMVIADSTDLRDHRRRDGGHDGNDGRSDRHRHAH